MDAIKRCFGCGDLYRQCANPPDCVVVTGRHLRPGRRSRNERLQERRCRGFMLGMSKLPGLSVLFWDFRNIACIVVGEAKQSIKQGGQQRTCEGTDRLSISVLLQPYRGRVSDLLGPTYNLISRSPLGQKRRQPGIQPIKISKILIYIYKLLQYRMLSYSYWQAHYMYSANSR